MSSRTLCSGSAANPSHQSADAPHLAARCNGLIVLAECEALEPRCKTDAKAYTCDHCNCRVLLRRTTHPRYHVSGFFAHKNKASTCTGGSRESAQHLQAKFWLQHFVGNYSVCLQRCRGCGPYLGFESKPTDGVHMELPHVIRGKRYVYDTVVTRAHKCALIIEVFHTHKTEQQKIDAIRGNGMHVAEVQAETVLDMVPALRSAKQDGTRVEIPNLLTTRMVCDACMAQYERGVQDVLMQERQFIFDKESCLDDCCTWTGIVLQHLDGLHAQYCMAYSTWLLHLAIVRRKKIQKRGFAMAFEKHEMIASGKRQQTFGFDRTNIICGLCKKWFPRTTLYPLPRDLWTEREYRSVQSWHADRNLPLPSTAYGCEDCTIDCEACNGRFPLDNARRYGLCFPCNLRK